MKKNKTIKNYIPTQSVNIKVKTLKKNGKTKTNKIKH